MSLLSLAAFSGNSLLCRAALQHTTIDAASFTSLRILAGAIVLALLVNPQAERDSAVSWPSVLALYVYMAAFSFAYQTVGAALGALLLFASVQFSMMVYGILRGAVIDRRALAGAITGITGLVVLTVPSTKSQLDAEGGALMVLAGIAWAIYSVRGTTENQPLLATARNFRWAVPVALAFNAGCMSSMNIDAMGAILAISSGAFTSGMGYAVWYSVLPSLGIVRAATIQLSVPAITSVTGVIFLREQLTWLSLLAETLILAGIALTIRRKS